MLLVLIKDKKTVTAEVEKEGTFLDVMIYEILCGEYVRVQKVIKTIVSSL